MGGPSIDLGQLWVYWVYMKQIKLHFATVMFIYDNFGKCIQIMVNKLAVTVFRVTLEKVSFLRYTLAFQVGFRV